MKLKRSILGSKSEKKVYKILETRWSEKFKILPQIPFSELIDFSPKELENKERDYFLKTSIDFTICTKSLSPLFSIEFDGIGGGYSRNGKYIPFRKTRDPFREIKNNFKLEIAAKVNYPLIIISYEELESIDKEDSLTILDGIIGQVLAKKEFLKKLSNYDVERITGGNELNNEYKDEYVQDFIIEAEVISEMKFDPIAYKAVDYQRKCSEIEKYTWSIESLSSPPLPNIKNIYDIDGIKSRIKAMNNIEKEGCKVTIKSEKFVVIQPVWIRNFEGSWICPFTIARNIAEYLAFKKAYLLFKKNRR